ncbi:unnamed protein product [Closterium sp. Naga37s-1]|nr:unnamed protein product [Closterium sp. Naga37s-1]CAI5533673.1 unnamed protein product [Closterium sp. Naga37s-1]
MQGVAGVLVELTQEVQELEESITNKVHQLIAGMSAVEHVQEAEQHLQRLEESVEGIRGLVEGVRMKMTEVGGSRELILVTQETVLCQQHQQEQQQQQQQVLQWHPEDQLQEPQQRLLKKLECRDCHRQISRGSSGESFLGTKRRMREMDAQLQQQVVKVQRIEKGLQSLATFHSTHLIKGFTTLDLSLTGITTLDLRHCTRITCRSMYHIRQLQHLDSLNLAWVATCAANSAANFAANIAADSAPGDR